MTEETTSTARPALYIVSVYRPDLYEEALRAVGVARDVEVVLDRRQGERRRRGRGNEADDRRRRDIDAKLATDGWALIPPEERGPSTED